MTRVLAMFVSSNKNLQAITIRHSAAAKIEKLLIGNHYPL